MLFTKKNTVTTMKIPKSLNIIFTILDQRINKTKEEEVKFRHEEQP